MTLKQPFHINTATLLVILTGTKARRAREPLKVAPGMLPRPHVPICLPQTAHTRNFTRDAQNTHKSVDSRPITIHKYLRVVRR